MSDTEMASAASVGGIDDLHGEALAKAVAVRVMGWEIPPDHSCGAHDYAYAVISLGLPMCRGCTWKQTKEVMPKDWRPDLNIAQAWEVVEYLCKQDGWFVQVHQEDRRTCCKVWFNNGRGKFGWLSEEYATTAPVAICRAALKAAVK